MSMNKNVGAYRHVRRIRQMRVLASAVILSLGFAAASPAVLPRPLALPHISAAGDPVIAAAGDIACDPTSTSFNAGNGSSSSCRMRYTSDLIVNGGYAAVVALGDNQYYCGGYSAYQQAYDLSWGRVKSITHPAVGNHEYLTSGGTGCDSSNTGAAGYFRYFGAAAGDPTKGYYSLDIGTWHVVALNSNCSSAGGCGTGSPQYNWLQSDLQAHPNACTLAYWHIPLYSSGGRASSNMRILWQVLYDNNADLVLEGHDHTYERFAPQDAAAGLDNARGLRSFIVGTGGANHTSFTTVAANSEVRDSSTYGILAVTLHPTSYDWQFIPEAGKTFTDSGSTACHGIPGPPDTTPPSVPTGLAGNASSGTSVGLTWNASTDNVGVASYTVFRNGSSIGTPTTTSFTDNGASPSTTYMYTVNAKDAAGNTSAQSAPVSVTTPATVGNLTFASVADAYIEQDLATTNFGTKTSVQVDGSPVKRSLLRFTVAGVGTHGVASAKLRLYCVDPSSFGGEIRSVTGTWSETTVTWSTSPAFGASAVSSVGSVVAGQWYEFNVSPLVTGNGDVTIGLLSTNTNGADYTSREGVAAQRPQLVVTPAP
jgi:chitodextrinase